MAKVKLENCIGWEEVNGENICKCVYYKGVYSHKEGGYEIELPSFNGKKCPYLLPKKSSGIIPYPVYLCIKPDIEEIIEIIISHTKNLKKIIQ